MSKCHNCKYYQECGLIRHGLSTNHCKRKDVMFDDKCERCINNRACDQQEYSLTCKAYQTNPNWENEMAANPKGYSKQMLLTAVENLNEVAGLNIRVKSKTVAQMVDPIADAILDADHDIIADDLDQDSLECLIAFGILGEGFCDEDVYSDKLIKALKSVDEDTVQAENKVDFDEDAGDDEDEDDIEEDDDGDNDDEHLEELRDELADLEEELEETTKKKKKKKLQARIDDLKAEIAEAEQDDEEEDEEDDEEEETTSGNTILDAAKQHISDMKYELENGELKKKAKKKLKKQIEEAEAELEEIMAEQETVKKPAEKKAEKKKSKTKKRPGVIVTIGEILQETDDYMSAEEIVEELDKRLPEGNPDTMIKTVKAQLYCRQPPCRLEKEKGIKVKIKGEGTNRTFKAK